MQNTKSYLEGLKFDPKLKDHFIAKYLSNFRFVLLLIISIIVLGTVSFFELPRRLNPEVKIPIVAVSTILPGAPPEDVESLVTIPLEDKIVGLEKVKTVSSSSLQNVSQIAVEFESSVDPQDAKDLVQSAVESGNELPQEAQTPNVQKLDFENQPVWTFLINSEKDEASLMVFAEKLKDDIKNIPTVKNVQVSGIETQEIQIVINQNAAKTYNINAAELSQMVTSAVHAQPAGTLNTKNSTFSLTIDSSINNINDIRNLVLNINGQIVQLQNIAQVAILPKPEIAKTYFVQKNQKITSGIVFSVYKSDSADITKTVKDIKKVVEKDVRAYQNNFKVTSIIDLSKLINDEFNNLIASFRDTIILVMIILFIFLGLRQALIVAFTIPLSFLVAFSIMNLTGITLNFLSLFSLILALGLLVDDAIVVVTAVTAYWKTKRFTPNQTGLLVLRDFVVPIWSTTITAVWAFLPILIATGIIGEFIKSISLVVSATLLASTAIAILITLPLMMVFLKPQFPNRVKILLNLILFALILGAIVLVSKDSPLFAVNLIVSVILLIVSFALRKQLTAEITRLAGKIINVKKVSRNLFMYMNHGILDSEKLARRYQKLIERVLNSPSAQNKTLIIVVCFALFSYLLLPAGFVKNEFFPKTSSDAVYANVELPTGTNLETTQKEAKNLLEELNKIEGVKFITAEVGKQTSSSDFFLTQGAPNTILFSFVLEEEDSINIANHIREKYKNYQTGKLSVIEQSGGPPAGADLQIKLKGEDLSILDNYADKIVDNLKSLPSTTNVEKSAKEGTGKIVFEPDKSKMAQYSLNEFQIGQSLRTFVSGFTLDKDITLEGEKYDITFRNNSKVESVQSLGTFSIPTKLGFVPLNSLGVLKLESNPTVINREDQKRTISISSGIKTGFNIPSENKKLESFAKNLNLPSDYSWQTGGVNEENQQSLNSIFKAMIIAIILITATMVLQFGSYRKAFIVILKIPLAISGVFIVFALTGTPLSFPTVIGILALFGITVYQSMLIIDKISRNQRAKMNLKHAIADACASRMEPILFGTLTTVVGLAPITLSDPLWRGLGGAIIAGLLFSGAIMLFFIPVIYYKIFRKESN